MIDSNLTIDDFSQCDVGREVAYQSYQQIDTGVITSVNDKYVFVRFGNNATAQGCQPNSLSFTS